MGIGPNQGLTSGRRLSQLSQIGNLGKMGVRTGGFCYCTYIKAHPPAVAPVDASRALASVHSATDRMPSRATLS